MGEQRIVEAENSLKRNFGSTLAGLSFLGSGLFSLASRRLGARVFSFDYDPACVACTRELKLRYFKNDDKWHIEEGSALDVDYLKKIGTFDIVYSWGVLHHTGNMYNALENINVNVKKGGKLLIALYNYQPFASAYWTVIKKLYNKFLISRPILIGLHLLYPTLPSVVLKLVTRRKIPRGMNIWVDLIDWVGGYPFEVSTPEQIVDFYHS